jgi:hypothetical protein
MAAAARNLVIRMMILPLCLCSGVVRMAAHFAHNDRFAVLAQ